MGRVIGVGRRGHLLRRRGGRPIRVIRRPMPSDTPILRWTLTGLGVLFVALGAVGVVVPVLPTTPFLLLAAACFARSSRRMHRWLLSNRLLGRYLRNYLERRSMTGRDKAVSISLLWIALIVTGGFVDVSWWVRVVLGLVGLGVSAHLLLLDPDVQ